MVALLSFIAYIIFAERVNPLLFKSVEIITTPFVWVFAVYVILRWYRRQSLPKRIT